MLGWVFSTQTGVSEALMNHSKAHRGRMEGGRGTEAGQAEGAAGTTESQEQGERLEGDRAFPGKMRMK